MRHWLVRVGQFGGELAGDVAGGLKTAAAQGRELIEWSDQIVDEIDEPLTSAALATQRVVFALADSLGVGDEVRAMVYLTRTIHYASPIAQGLASGPVGVAVATTLGSLGAFGALGAAGVVAGVVAVLGELFGDDDDEQKAKDKRKRVRTDLRALLDRLDLAGFAAEQDRTAGRAASTAKMPPASMSGGVTHFNDGTSVDWKAQAATAIRLAAFFRAAGAKLGSRERAIFVALLNLGRWAYALDRFRRLSKHDQEVVSDLAEPATPPSSPFEPPKPAPEAPPFDYGQRLEQLVASEQNALEKLSMERMPPSSSSWVPAVLAGVVLLAGGAAALHFLAPGVLAPVMVRISRVLP